MQAASIIPRLALALGWLGVFLFAAFALLGMAVALVPRGAASYALILYGVVVLSFMGGAQWGLAMVATRGETATSRVGAAPWWHPALRVQLTSAVVICLLLSPAFGRSA